MTAAPSPPLRVLHLCPDTRYLTQLFALYRDALDQPPFESTLVFLRGEPDAALAQRIGGRVQFLDLPRRALEGLRRAAEAIGEADEANRCDEFLHQLDPGWDRRPEPEQRSEQG